MKSKCNLVKESKVSEKFEGSNTKSSNIGNWLGSVMKRSIFSMWRDQMWPTNVGNFVETKFEGRRWVKRVLGTRSWSILYPQVASFDVVPERMPKQPSKNNHLSFLKIWESSNPIDRHVSHDPSLWHSPLKINGWKMKFPFWTTHFQGLP